MEELHINKLLYIYIFTWECKCYSTLLEAIDHCQLIFFLLHQFPTGPTDFVQEERLEIDAEEDSS